MIEINRFAHRVLFGDTLEDKLCLQALRADEFKISDSSAGLYLKEPPAFPGRPGRLKQPGKTPFPPLHRLKDPDIRAEVLHFFANHELLAIELMALLLLRFPEAPISFRKGILRTLKEEQSHLELYIQRMRKMGLEFGDLPVNDYFWNCMSTMRSPLDFVTQMSLSFEQANLDFSLFFKNEFEKVGDIESAALLDRIYQDEIGHVKHGVVWFNRWRTEDSSSPAGESDWSAYERLLPPPMNPRRAKGIGYCKEARKQAGLSEIFIRELEVYSGSKGRPPTLWLFNPSAEDENARGKSGFTPNAKVIEIAQDLESLLLFLAAEQDILFVHDKPDTDWLKELQDLGIKIPNFQLIPSLSQIKSLPDKCGNLQPWAWSPHTFDIFKPLAARSTPVSGGNYQWSQKFLSAPNYSDTGLRQVFSKSWSAQFLRDWMIKNTDCYSYFGDISVLGHIAQTLPEALTHFEQILSVFDSVMIKAPYGTSGNQVKRVKVIDERLLGWIKNTINIQGSVVIEPYLNRVADFSVQLKIDQQKTILLETRRFLIGAQHEYQGTYLGQESNGFDANQMKLIHQSKLIFQKLLKDIGDALRAAGYEGPAGVDAFIWKDQDENLRIKPVVEINPRWTMGRVALAIEKYTSPKSPALWLLLNTKQLKKMGFSSFVAFADFIRKAHPLKIDISGDRRWISDGVLFTTQVGRSKNTLTVLFVGSDAIDYAERSVLRDTT